MRHKHIVIVH